MEPIKVILVNNENIIIALLNNPFVSFILGSIVTIILTNVMQNRRELLSKKEKIVEIRISVSTIIRSLKNILVYMRPQLNLPIKEFVLNGASKTKEERDKDIRERNEKIINDNMSVILSQKEKILPIIDIYIYPLNKIYLNSLFECYDIIIEKFHRNPLMMKEEYGEDIKKEILNSTRNTFIQKLSEAIDQVYLLETKNNKNKIKKFNKLNIGSWNYIDFFNDTKQRASKSQNCYKEEKMNNKKD